VGGFFICLDGTVGFEGFTLASANPLRIAQLLPLRGSPARRGRATPALPSRVHHLDQTHPTL
jgi:hypothetical protein